MKKRTTTYLLALGLLSPLAMNAPLRAQTTQSSQGSGGMNSPANAALVQAAATDLATADHDYDGHRVKALAALQAFAKNNHIPLQEGGGKGGEAQITSDDQLRDAESKLQQVGPNGGKYPNLSKAIREISTALSLSPAGAASPSAGAVNSTATPASNTTSPSVAPSGDISGVAPLLQSAYQNLSTAQFNYGGQKLPAMRIIANVAQQIGCTLPATQRESHGQGTSDWIIKHAVSALQQASSILSANNHGRQAEELNKAIAHLTVAQSVR